MSNLEEFALTFDSCYTTKLKKNQCNLAQLICIVFYLHHPHLQWSAYAIYKLRSEPYVIYCISIIKRRTCEHLLFLLLSFFAFFLFIVNRSLLLRFNKLLISCMILLKLDIKLVFPILRFLLFFSFFAFFYSSL